MNNPRPHPRSLVHAVALAVLLAYYTECSRGNFRRYVRARHARFAAIGRRAFHREDGVRFLLPDFADADFTRVTEAANTDPRPPANGGTGAGVWDFPDTTTFNNIEVLPPLSGWTNNGTVRTTGLADPLGGTAAESLEDDSAAAAEFIAETTVQALATGSRFECTFFILKDSDTSRFPEIQLLSGAMVFNTQINTSTGASTIRTNTSALGSVTVATAPESSLWWKVTLSFTSPSSGVMTMNFIPAMSTVFGTVEVAATGTTTFFPGELFQNAAWKRSDEARIFSDGATLIEGARTNTLTESADASTWAKTGTGTETSGQTAPDLSTFAWRVEDTDAAAVTTYTQASGALGISTHVYSAYVLKDSDVSRFPEFEIFAGSAVITGGAVRVQINTDTGATATRTGTPTSVTVLDAGLWWRIVIVIEVTTGGTAGTRFRPAAGTVLGVLNNAATGAATAWGFQLEAGDFVGSPIRTSGAAATRNKDDMEFLAASVPLAIYTGKFQVVVWPNFDSGDIGNSGTIFNCNTTFGDNLTFIASGGTKVRLKENGGTFQDSDALTFSAGQKITITVDHALGEIKIEGATTGNGTFTKGSALDWTTTSNVFVGQEPVGGGMAHMVIGRPVAA